MLAVVKEHHIEKKLGGETANTDELLAFLRSRYTIDVLQSSMIEDNEEDDDEWVDIRDTDFWKSTTPGRLLAGFRLKHELTQKQLAQKLGIHPWIISAYERDKREITPEVAGNFARALGEDPDMFYRILTELP